MKKVLLLLSILLFVVTPVSAQENKLYVIEKDGVLYYERDFIDANHFMNHTDMVPGSEFTDELIIENGSDIDFDMYFKVVPKDGQSNNAEELLESIEMKITIDGEVIYEGSATGLDYTSQGVNLQDAVSLGKFTPGKQVKMVVETKLSTQYSNTNNEDSSYIDWSFYAQYGDADPDPTEPTDTDNPTEPSQPVQIIESPNTMQNTSIIIPIAAVAIVLIGLGVIMYARKK